MPPLGKELRATFVAFKRLVMPAMEVDFDGFVAKFLDVSGFISLESKKMWYKHTHECPLSVFCGSFKIIR